MPLRFERTFDYPLVRSLMTHPRVYRWLQSDGAPPASEYRPPENPLLWYVLAYDGSELLGLFIFAPQTRVCWEAHICMLPSAWGFKSVRACQQVIPWFGRAVGCKKIVGSVPADNRCSLRIVRAAGGQLIGVNEASILRDGVLSDQILFGWKVSST